MSKIKYGFVVLLLSLVSGFAAAETMIPRISENQGEMTVIQWEQEAVADKSSADPQSS